MHDNGFVRETIAVLYRASYSTESFKLESQKKYKFVTKKVQI